MKRIAEGACLLSRIIAPSPWKLGKSGEATTGNVKLPPRQSRWALLLVASCVGLMVVSSIGISVSDNASSLNGDAGFDNSTAVDGVRLMKSAVLPTVFAGAPNEVLYRFRVVNDTVQTIDFKPLRASGCGCSSASLDKLRLEPGEEAGLRVRVNTWKASGTRNVSIDLPNSTGVPWQYRLKLNVYERMRFLETHCSMGILDPGQSASRTVTLEVCAPTRAELPRLERLTSSNEQMAVSIVRRKDLIDENGVCIRRLTLKLLLPPQGLIAHSNAQVIAVASMGKQSFEDSLSAVWRVRARFEAYPKRLFFGSLSAANGEEVRPVSQRTIVLRSGKNHSFRLRTIESSHAAISCDVETAEPGKVHVVTATLDPNQLIGSVWGQIKVSIDDDTQPELAIPFAAIVRGDLRANTEQSSDLILE